MISMLMLGALTLVRERERGNWETLQSTPIEALDALVGKLAPYVVIGGMQAAVVIGVARLLFALPVTGPLWALLGAVPLYAGAHLILGFALSALAESQMQAIQGAVFFYLPSMLLSGFMFPFQAMPVWPRLTGARLPLRPSGVRPAELFSRGAARRSAGTRRWPEAGLGLAPPPAALIPTGGRLNCRRGLVYGGRRA